MMKPVLVLCLALGCHVFKATATATEPLKVDVRKQRRTTELNPSLRGLQTIDQADANSTETLTLVDEHLYFGEASQPITMESFDSSRYYETTYVMEFPRTPPGTVITCKTSCPSSNPSGPGVAYQMLGYYENENAIFVRFAQSSSTSCEMSLSLKNTEVHNPPKGATFNWFQLQFNSNFPMEGVEITCTEAEATTPSTSNCLGRNNKAEIVGNSTDSLTLVNEHRFFGEASDLISLPAFDKDDFFATSYTIEYPRTPPDTAITCVTSCADTNLVGDGINYTLVGFYDNENAPGDPPANRAEAKTISETCEMSITLTNTEVYNPTAKGATYNWFHLDFYGSSGVTEAQITCTESKVSEPGSGGCLGRMQRMFASFWGG